MQKTNIEWCDYSFNPVKGLCPMRCPYCYARAMYQRFKWNPEIRLDTDEINQMLKFKKKGQKIFVGSTIDLFCPEVISQAGGLHEIIEITKQSQNWFLFLTKNPAIYSCWMPSVFGFNNRWLGVSIDKRFKVVSAQTMMEPMRFLKTKGALFVSFEPLLNPIEKSELKLLPIFSWIIIGGLNKKPPASPDYYRAIIEVARENNIPVFLKWDKNNWNYPEELK